MKMFEKIYKLVTSACVVSDVEFLKELQTDVISSATKYAWIRNEWNTMSREERINRDSGRTAMHNTFISNLTVLFRFLAKEGIEGEEMNMLEKLLERDRKEIGDFACFIVYQIMLENR